MGTTYMNEMIKVKMHTGWHEVSYEQALSYARHLYDGILTMSREQRIEYINSNKVDGVKFTIEELAQ